FIAPGDVAQVIRADLEKTNERDRRFRRYFTLTHLFNAGLSKDALQTYRNGLSKLINSLSWGRRIAVPIVIDSAQTILRIGLRDYQCAEQEWDTILRGFPYGTTDDPPALTACRDLTSCQLPHIRADWFVAAASRPPLYHQILQLPVTAQELEKQLRVDVKAN